jgi:hypothetical protein
MEFLDLLESMSAAQADTARLFGSEGRGVRQMRRADPAYLARLAETASFVADIYTGRKPTYYLREALTTSDFPLLFGDVLDRQLLQDYRETPQTYRNWCRIATVSDFRLVRRFAVNGSEAILAAVAQLAPYPESSLSDLKYEYQVLKYGRQIPLSWESIINDDLQALRDIPSRFGRAARRSEEKFATQLIAGATGPHATFFTLAHKNTVVVANGASAANPPLSISGLQDAFAVLASQVDTDGEPISIDAVELIVPPALQVVAQNILNATQLLLGGLGQVGGGGNAAQAVMVANWMQGKTRLNVNSYLPIVSPTNGNTSWYLVASPQSTRPAFEMGFLRGHEGPEVFIKEPNQRRIGAASLDAMDGDFDTDSIQYKVRDVFGGVQMDYKAAVASNGTGT